MLHWKMVHRGKSLQSTVRSVETGLGRLTLVVAVVSVDVYPYLAFPNLTCHLEDTGICWLQIFP